MRKTLREKLHRLAEYIELVVAIIITFVVIVSVISMIIRILTHPTEIHDEETFYAFLESALSLIVGIEFLKMIIIPTTENVIETLLFAVSRQIILDHNITVTIVGIISVTILFLIKKFLITDFEEKEDFVARGSSLVTKINKLTESELPLIDGHPKIGSYLKYQLEQQGIPIQKFAKVNVNGVTLVALSVDKNKNIRLVEVQKEEKNENKHEKL